MRTFSMGDMLVIEELTTINRRQLFLRGVIKRILEEHGKNPSDELLNAATDFAMRNHILPSMNPAREHWFIEMLCCFCDGKEFIIKD